MLTAPAVMLILMVRVIGKTFAVSVVLLAAWGGSGRPARADRLGLAPRALENVRLTHGAGMLVLTAGPEALVFSLQGRALGNVGRRPQTTSSPTGAQGGSRSRDAQESLLESLGVPEEVWDLPAAEDLVDDETSRAERRRALEATKPAFEQSLPPAAPGTQALAAGTPSVLWVAAAGGLWRAEGRRPLVRVAQQPSGTRALAVAKDGTLFAATDTEILASTDPGVRFFRVATPPSPAERLVVSPSGAWVLWSSAVPGQVRAIGRAGENLRWSVPERILDLAFCGPDVVALGQRRLFRLAADGGVAVVGENPGGRRLFCPPGEATPADGLPPAEQVAPLAVVGPRLWLSFDGGRRFEGPMAGLGSATALSDAALAPTGLWLVDAHKQVFRFSDEVPLPTGWPDVRPARRGPDEELAIGTLTRKAVSPWVALLPRLGIEASVGTSLFGRDYRAYAFAEVPLSPPAPPPVWLAQAEWPPERERNLRSQSPALSPSWSPDAFLGPDARAADNRCLLAVRRAAVARALVEPERALSLLRRAGNAAWLPELRFRVERRVGRSESFDIRPTAANPTGETFGLDGVDDVRYEVRATWDLPSLVFNREEISAAQQALRMADMRREIESQVNRLFFDRRRLLQGPALDPTLEPQERLATLEELAAELEALSGGALSRCERGGSDLR